MTPKQVLEFAAKNGAEMVDFKFCDLPGTWQHFTTPTSELEEDLFEDGLGFDGSSIRGWQKINESDMLVVPDPNTALMDPFSEAPTLSLVCDIHDPITGERYSRNPRNVFSCSVSVPRNACGLENILFLSKYFDLHLVGDLSKLPMELGM